MNATRISCVTYAMLSLVTMGIIITAIAHRQWWSLNYEGGFGYTATITIGLWKACLQEIAFPEDCRDYIRESPFFSDKVEDMAVIRTFLFIGLFTLFVSTLGMSLLTCKRSRGFITRHILWTIVLTCIVLFSLLIVIGFSTLDEANPSKPFWMALPASTYVVERNYEISFILVCVAAGFVFLLVCTLITHLVVTMRRSKSQFLAASTSRYAAPKHLEMSSRDYLEKRYEGGVYKSDINSNIGKINSSFTTDTNIGKKNSVEKSEYYSGSGSGEGVYENQGLGDYEILGNDNEVFDGTKQHKKERITSQSSAKTEDFIQLKPSISSRGSESSLTTFPTNKTEDDGNKITRCNSVPVSGDPKIVPILHLSELRRHLTIRQEEEDDSSSE